MKTFNTSIFTLIVLTLTFISSTALAEADAYMLIKVNGAAVNGGVTSAGNEGAFRITEMHHLFRHTTSTEHEPIIVTTPMFRGLPVLLSALDNGSTIEFDIKLYNQDPNVGGLRHYYTISILQGKLVAAEPIMYDNQNNETASRLNEWRLRFTYNTITHNDEIFSTSATLEVNP